MSSRTTRPTIPGLRWPERQARADGALIVLQVVLLGRAKAELRAGRFMAAEMTYEEVVDITRAVGGPPEFYEMLKCDLYAWRGQEDEARAAAAPLREAAAAIGSAAAVGIADLAMATLDLGAGRYADALRVVEPMAEDNLPGWTCLALPIAVEAAARSGDFKRANEYLSRFRDRTAGADAAWARGQLARCQALLADDSEAEGLFLEAIRLLDTTTVTTEANQARLAYGEWLRRQNRQRACAGATALRVCLVRRRGRGGLRGSGPRRARGDRRASFESFSR